MNSPSGMSVPLLTQTQRAYKSETNLFPLQTILPTLHISSFGAIIYLATWISHREVIFDSFIPFRPLTQLFNNAKSPSPCSF